jgi:hypothetical protein
MLSLLTGARAFAADFESLLASRLESSSSYRNTLISLRKAELAEAQFTEAFIPNVSLSANGNQQGGVVLRDGEFQPVSLRGTVSFSGLLGADLTLSLPVTFGSSRPGDAPAAIGNPSLSISRRLFPETDLRRLSARASLIRARDAVVRAEADHFIGLVSDILSAKRAVTTLGNYRSSAAVRERLAEVTVNSASQREVQRALLQAKRTLLQAEASLRTVPAEILSNLDSLYEEVYASGETWFRNFPAARTVPATSAEIEALTLDLQAAELERSRWFLPYLPNPTVSAGLEWDTGRNRLSWSISFQLSATVLDKGERAVSALERRETAEIRGLTLEARRTGLIEEARQAWDRLELLELDRRIAELDLTDRREALERQRALFEAGFATEEDLVLAEVSYTSAELQLLQTEHEHFLQRLRIMRLTAADSAAGDR